MIDIEIIKRYSDIKISFVLMFIVSIGFAFLMEKTISHKRKIYAKEYDDTLYIAKEFTKDVRTRFDLYSEKVDLLKSEHIDFKEDTNLKFKKFDEMVDDDVKRKYDSELSVSLKVAEKEFTSRLDKLKEEIASINKDIEKANRYNNRMDELKELISELRTFKGVIKDLVSFKLD